MKKLTLALCALIVFGLTAAKANEEFTSLRDVLNSPFALDYVIQGEYKDTVQNRYYQIIADGNLNFRVTGYPDGLPGAGWDRSMARFFGHGVIEDGVLVITGDKMDIPKYEGVEGKTREIIFDEDQQNRKIRISVEGDKFYLADDKRPTEKHELVKINRVSPSLGQKAPEGAFVVFDGTGTENLLEGAKINEETRSLWSEAQTVTFEKDRPYLLHVEFLTSFMPTSLSQGRSNSGVYVAEAYECQVLDSFGLNGENNECGGFYQFAMPIVNMCLPPLTWQTYDIEFTPVKYEDGKKVANACVTVRHNGVVIHDQVELPNQTPGCKGEADEARGLYLQGHGNHVQYRNIWVQYQ